MLPSVVSVTTNRFTPCEHGVRVGGLGCEEPGACGGETEGSGYTAAKTHVTWNTLGATGGADHANQLPAEQTEVEISSTSNPVRSPGVITGGGGGILWSCTLMLKKKLSYVSRKVATDNTAVLWISVFRSCPQGLRVLCLPIIYNQQYFKGPLYLDMKSAVLPGNRCLSLSLFHYLFFFFFLDSQIYPVLSNDPPLFISLCCYLTLLLIGQSLCPLKVTVIENSHRQTVVHTHTHALFVLQHVSHTVRHTLPCWLHDPRRAVDWCGCYKWKFNQSSTVEVGFGLMSVLLALSLLNIPAGVHIGNHTEVEFEPNTHTSL